MKSILLGLMWVSSVVGFAAEKKESVVPDIRITVKAISDGTDHGKDGTSVTHRRLQVRLENRGHVAVDQLQVQWKIMERDINSRKVTTAATGTLPVKLEADEVKEVETSAAKMVRHEGKPKQVGKGNNRHLVVERDSGKDYAGYVVEVTRNGTRVAEAATVGMGHDGKVAK